MCYKVKISCSTFNFAPYIKDAMDSICEQKTTFPYLYVIVDDASTDSSQLIITEYLEKFFNLQSNSVVIFKETDDYKYIFAQNKKNPNCYFAVYLLKYNHFSIKKSRTPYFEQDVDSIYTAFCEGDDYWADPYKLQKQVDLLDANPEMGMVHSDCCVYNMDNGEKIHFINRIQSKNTNIDTTKWYDSIIAYYRNEIVIRTCTAVIRTNLYKKIKNDDPFLFDGHLMLGDTQIWIGILLNKKSIGYIDDDMAIYRVHNGSMTHSNSYKQQLGFAISRYEIRLYYKRKYKILSEFKDIEKNYYKYVRLYRFLYAPSFKDIDGNVQESNTFLRFFSNSRLLRSAICVLINIKHNI